jgi:hypothetical protein
MMMTVVLILFCGAGKNEVHSSEATAAQISQVVERDYGPNHGRRD